MDLKKKKTGSFCISITAIYHFDMLNIKGDIQARQYCGSCLKTGGENNKCPLSKVRLIGYMENKFFRRCHIKKMQCYVSRCK